MPIKTFRGMIKGADTGNMDQITLHTNTGSTGYRLKKLQTMQKSPGTTRS
jgi:hypothetical protein